MSRGWQGNPRISHASHYSGLSTGAHARDEQPAYTSRGAWHTTCKWLGPRPAGISHGVLWDRGRCPGGKCLMVERSHGGYYYVRAIVVVVVDAVFVDSSKQKRDRCVAGQCHYQLNASAGAACTRRPQ